MSSTLTSRIQDLIAKSSYSKTEIADRAGVSKQVLYKYEKGLVTNIPSDRLESLAFALQTTPAYLMGWEELEDAQQKANAYQDEIEQELAPLFDMNLTKQDAQAIVQYAKFLISQRG